MLTFRPFLALAIASVLAVGGTTVFPIGEAARAQTNGGAATDGSFFGYVPPDRGAPRRTRGAGSRGCQADKPVGLTLLVPIDHTGRTVASHPTFSWHLTGATNVPVEFSLIQPGVAQPVYSETLPAQPEGYGQLTLPAELPGLVAGQEYRWSVEAICNPKRPSSNIFAQGWIERVEADATLADSLASAATPRDEAIAYAKAGV
ncbi:MAG: DUF928 domain-containing protein, partial [Cyanobacteria bacterium J06639_1]